MSALAATVASERIKLGTLRSTYWVIGAGLMLGLLLTVGSSIAIGETWGDWSGSDRATFDPTLFAFAGTLFSSIFFAVLGVTAAATEYSSGMIRLTLTATPRRGRFLAAKVLVVAAVTLAASLVATVGFFLLTQAILGSYGLATASLGDADAIRAVGVTALLGPVFPVIGVSLAILVRSTAGAITTLLAFIVAPAIFGGLLPEWFQDNVLRYFPGSATDSLSTSHLVDGPENIGTFVAIVVIAAWLAAFIGAAYVTLMHRDA